MDIKVEEAADAGNWTAVVDLLQHTGDMSSRIRGLWRAKAFEMLGYKELSKTFTKHLINAWAAGFDISKNLQEFLAKVIGDANGFLEVVETTS